jgi:hypothetical protein
VVLKNELDGGQLPDELEDDPLPRIYQVSRRQAYSGPFHP